MILEGKYGKAVVYTDEIEEGAVSQIINLLNQPMAKDADVRIMPDVHAGAGCVIGYTAKLTDKIVPNLIGVDIGCGVTAYKLGPKHEVGAAFDKLDAFIRENIPSGRNIHDSFDNDMVSTVFDALGLKFKGFDFRAFNSRMIDICCSSHQNFDYVRNSIGTLGGGNHFIEIDEDNDHILWLVVHSGSRNFGLKIANHHQKIAEDSVLGIDKFEFNRRVEEIKATKKGKGIEVAINKLRKEISKHGKATGLEYLEGAAADIYYMDMNIAQMYAQINRATMLFKIVVDFYKQDFDTCKIVESIHNYINYEDKIVRKGAISAHDGEKVIIPLNMADGIIVGTGKGNANWNYSAPHGAGRKMSRSKAKSTIDLDEFQKIMKSRGVWTSTAGKQTLDEAPQAYKKAEHIIEYLKPSVDIDVHMKPIYNYKAAD